MEKIRRRFEYVQNNLLEDKSFLVGNKFSIADSYLYIMLSWSGYVGLDMTPFPQLRKYAASIGRLPYVIKAHTAMATNPKST